LQIDDGLQYRAKRLADRTGGRRVEFITTSNPPARPTVRSDRNSDHHLSDRRLSFRVIYTLARAVGNFDDPRHAKRPPDAP
jgi:hypothetical protein